MCKKFVIAAVVCLLFVPMLFSDMTSLSGDSFGMPGQGMGGGGGMGMQGQGMGGGHKAHSGDSNQEKKNVPALPTDNVSDILSFQDKLNLTSQQVISINLIAADTQQELTQKSSIVKDCKREYDKSLFQNTPDFAYIHSMLNKLIEAQTNAFEVSVSAYEKAYALLTETQKANLSFFRALRQQEIEKEAESASTDTKQAASTSTITNSPALIKQ